MYAPDMWPIMGLKSAVIVVGGSEMGEGEGEERWLDGDCDDVSSTADDSSCGLVAWNDGAVASGRVVNRIPVDTVERSKG